MLQYSVDSQRRIFQETGSGQIEQKREERNMANVYVFTADGFEEIEGLTVVDLMRRAGAQVKMVSISDGLAVKGSHGIEIKADTFFDDVTSARQIFCASGWECREPFIWENMKDLPGCSRILRPRAKEWRLFVLRQAYWADWDC